VDWAEESGWKREQSPGRGDQSSEKRGRTFPSSIGIGVRLAVSKGVEDGRRLQAGHPINTLKTVLGVARPQGIEGLGMAGPSQTSGSPWPPLAIHPCLLDQGKWRNSRQECRFLGVCRNFRILME
jgi:hypothetical protein